ncbi:hypothetical protein [Phycicoccus sp.]|uniref:hypothetical protein n=1 Tax=Phycicoccus sp. TaxID=1902410 RepID=UPI002BDA369E|nr:hypothetical protein [Phycicoccus sp.]HMM95351.1 hypothetical protein [Phycicoccus sp.]
MADTDPDLNRGLYGKYLVQRADGDPAQKHTDCRYFVLDPEHDPAALAALSAYIEEARDLGYVQLADDLDVWLEQLYAHHPPQS